MLFALYQDEESDYLFPLEEGDLQRMMENASDCDWESSDMSVGSEDQTGDAICPTASNQEMANKDEDNDMKSTSDTTSEKLGQDNPMSCDSHDQEQEDGQKGSSETASQKSGGESSSVGCESDFSKTSSDLTPSDQRSNEEAYSSLKESDGSLKSDKVSDLSSNDNKDSSESEQENKAPKTSTPYDVFFTSCPVKFSKKSKSTVPWLQETEMNRTVAMEYTLSSSAVKNRLCHDKLRLRDMSQPDMVKQQFESMLEELNLQTVLSTKEQELTDSLKRTPSSGTIKQSGQMPRRKLSAHSRSRDPKRKSKFDDKVFDGLFISMFSEDFMEENSASQSDSSPDIEDVSNSLDEID